MCEVFVAVATCKRNQLLVKNLTSLDRPLPKGVHRLQVCVGDNDPQGGAAECVQSMKSRVAYDLFYVHCPEPGIPQVRNVLLNRALATTSCAVLIFIDDDEIADKSWLEELWGYYWSQRGRIHAIHGPVLPLFSKTPPPWLPVELYGRDLENETGKKLKLAASGNVLLDLTFLREKGLLFDERMALTGGSDTEFFYRFVKAGGEIHWCNEAKVYEYTTEKRLTIKWLLHRSFRLGTSDIMFWRSNHSWSNTLFWGLRRSVWNFIKNMSYLAVPGKSRNYYIKHAIFLVKTFGLLSGMFGYRYSEYRQRHVK